MRKLREDNTLLSTSSPVLPVICYTTQKGVEDRTMQYNEQIRQYLEYCKFRKELDANTLKAYRIDLRQFFEYTEENIPQRDRIEEYITDLHKLYKQKTIKRKIASVKAYYAYLEEREIIDDNPFRKIKVRFKETVILPRIIFREEIECLLNYMYAHINESSGETYKSWLRDTAVIETFFATGARVYEISNITSGNIDLSTGLIRIMGKGGTERIFFCQQPRLQIYRTVHAADAEEIQ